MANRIVPDATEPCTPALLDLMKKYVESKLCYHSNALTNARVLQEQERVAYQIDLWTLMEQRQVKERVKPYEGEQIEAQPLTNPLSLEFQKPPTILAKKQKQVYDIKETRRVIICSKCNGHGASTCYSCGGTPVKHCGCSTGGGLYYNERGNCGKCKGTGVRICSICNATGKINCSKCETRGKLLLWYQLIIEYYTLHSLSYQTDTPLPTSRINEAPTKEIYWSFDQEWAKENAFYDYFQPVFANQHVQCPLKLDEVTKQYNTKHLEKSKPEYRIVRLKCKVQKLNITEVEYETKGFANKQDTQMGDKFKFYYYGKGKKDEPLIYENDYPMNKCGCFGAGCAHYSKCCTIS